jgi:cation diffusion facilitator CzcD-associated flavoprotein CzcO
VTSASRTKDELDALIVGAGLAGVYMLHRLRALGLSARIYEAGSGVGGTWFWNCYPGARCDVESMDYSYSFSEELQQEWHWSERYAAQPEILAYINHVVDRFDLRRDIEFNTRVIEAVFDEAIGRWSISTDRGERVGAQFCIMATGCLSAAQMPRFPGLETFEGDRYHTGHWPHEGVDFTERRVAVIGTGSSAIQSIPIIAEQAAHLFVFQRTPNFAVPAHNAPLDPDYERQVKASYADFRRAQRESRLGFVVESREESALAVAEQERQREYEKRWNRGGLGFGSTFADLLSDKAANDTAADFFRGKIRTIVRDPAIAETLTPKEYPIGTKRLCVDTNYYATFNRNNVTLVDLRKNPIEAITPHGVQTRDVHYPVDAIVFATGFDAMTGALLNIDIRGRTGRSLRQKWEAGPRTYLGIAVAGFPNLFMITGPGSPSVLSNMIVSIEQHVDWIADCIRYLRENGCGSIEAGVEAEDAWVNHVNAIGHMTLYPQANSWYMGANIPGKPRVFMPYIGGVAAYRQKCDEVAAKGYEGFEIASAASAPLAGVAG